MEVSPRSQQLAITGPSILENIVIDPSTFKRNGGNLGSSQNSIVISLYDQQLVVAEPSILKNPVTDPSIFKRKGGSLGRPKKFCYPADIDVICTWNVEGMRGDSAVKLVELRLYMKKYSIGILCLQETHLLGAHFMEEDGFSVFLSGASLDVGCSYAGVGFMVAPWVTRAIVSFKAIIYPLCYFA